MTNRPSRGILASLIGTFALVAAALVIPSGSAQAAITQGIAGTITRSDGDTSISAWVLVQPVGDELNYDETGHFGSQGYGDNTYEGFLKPGKYWVQFGAYGTAPQWWGGAPTRGASTQVTVVAGQITTLNVTLQPGGSISGHLAQAGLNHTNPEGLVKAFVPDATYASGYAQFDGSLDDETHDYVINDLPSGDYKIYFYLFGGFEGYLQNKTTLASANPISVTAPAAVTNLSPTLPPAPKITGTVTDAVTGQPIPNASITPYYWDGEHWNFVSGVSGYTDTKGVYSFQVPASDYRLGVTTDGRAGFHTEYWNNAADVDHAQTLSVSIGSTTTADVALDRLPPLKNTGLPVITNPVKIGGLIGHTLGTWTPADDLTFSRQWLRNGVPIPGQTGSSYLIKATDAGQRISVRVTAYRPTLFPTGATSRTVTVPLQTLQRTAPATLAGTLKVGKTLRATAPRCTPTATAKYQWIRNGVAIRGATSATHKLIRADRGKKVGVRISLVRAGYATVTVTLTRTNRVK